MKTTIFLLVLTSMISCSSLNKKKSTQFKVESHSKKVESIFEAKSNFFNRYMESSLEKSHKNFYDDLAFSSKVDPNWKENKKRAISGLAQQFKKNKIKISTKHTEIYSRAPELLKQTIQKIPFDRQINVIVTPLFTSGGTVRVRHDGIFMGVGSNILIQTSNTDWVIPHELTHASHIIYSNFPGVDRFDEWKNDGKLFWGLWTEGIGSYGAFLVLNPKSLDRVFGFPEYSKFKLDIIGKTERDLAKKFLKVMNNKYIDFSDKTVMFDMKNWFGVESDLLGPNTPRSPGYYLGFLVIKSIIEDHKYTFKDVLSMKKEKAEQLIHKQLVKISRL